MLIAGFICFAPLSRTSLVLYHLFFFFFNDTATTEIYTLSLHDALPILRTSTGTSSTASRRWRRTRRSGADDGSRSEEHTSELQSLTNLVCRLLLEKKKKRLSQSSRTHVNFGVSGVLAEILLLSVELSAVATTSSILC